MSKNFNLKNGVLKSEENSYPINYQSISILPNLSPALKIEKAFSILTETMKDCLYARAKSAFYVMRAACGSGKSRTSKAFIRNWKTAGFPGDGSILMLLPTKNDIDDYICDCGLDRMDYTCYTSDAAYNTYGAGRDGANEAKVLFTTQEQLRRRASEVDSFADLSAFHYRGKPRTLRIWEESLLAAAHVAVRIDAVTGLLDDLRIIAPRLARALDAFLPDKAERVEGALLDVPAHLGDLIDDVRGVHVGRLGPAKQKILEELRKVAGGQVILRDSERGWVMVGAGQPLPADLAPMIVVDASSRMRPSYDIRDRYKGDIIWLPEVDIRYERLTINFWDKGCGKSVLGYPEQRSAILSPVIGIINARANEKWLIIHPMKALASATTHGFDIEAEVKKALHQRENVAFLHWGKHLSTNAHREVRNIIVIGGLNYGKHAYEAMHMAASGITAGNDEELDRQAIEDGEFQHNLYQAICRGNVRNAPDGVGGECTVYLVASNQRDKKHLLKGAFPGCTINTWTPVPKRKSKVELVMETIARLLQEEGPRIPISAVWKALGAKGSSYLTKEWHKPEMIAFLRDSHIKRDKKTLYKTKMLTSWV